MILVVHTVCMSSFWMLGLPLVERNMIDGIDYINKLNFLTAYLDARIKAFKMP